MINRYPQQGGGNYYSPDMGFYTQGPGPGPYYVPAPPTPARQEKKRIRRCGNFLGLAVILYTVTSMMVGAVVYGAVWLAPGIVSGQLMEQIATMVTYIASFALPFGVCAALERMPLRTALPLRRFNGKITLLAIPLSMGASVAASYLTALVGAAFSAVGMEASSPEFPVPSQTAAFVLYVVNMAVLPAFLEEFAFRGVILQSLRRFGDAFAVGMSAVIFGLMHMNLVQAPYAIVMGLLFGYLTVRTGSLWTGIILHFINNMTSVGFQVLLERASASVQQSVNAAYTLLCLMMGALGLVLYLLKGGKLWFFRPAGTVCSGGKKALYLFTSAGMIVALVQIALFMAMTLRWEG